MSFSKASRVSEEKRHFVIAIDAYREGEISGVIFHMGHPEPLCFESIMDLVWIVEEISDKLSWPLAVMKQRQFKRLLPAAKKTVPGGGGKVRRGSLATLKLKLSYRNYASWQGVAAWVEKEQTKPFRSFLELVRYIGGMVEPDNQLEGGQKDLPLCNISVDKFEAKCLAGRMVPLSHSYMAEFHSILGLAKNLDAMLSAGGRDILTLYPMEKLLLSSYYPKGQQANFVVRIRFCEHSSWQGSIFWHETGQTVNFRSFLELVKLMDLAVMNTSRLAELGSNH